MVKKDKDFTLQLSPEEASVLLALLDHVGGSPTHSRRGLADNVSRRLRALGAVSRGQDIRGVFYFVEKDHA